MTGKGDITVQWVEGLWRLAFKTNLRHNCFLLFKILADMSSKAKVTLRHLQD